MPRKRRIVLTNTAHHIVQRGHNRNAVFIDEKDYDYYINTLKEWKDTLQVKVYGYCLMTNHVHLIVDPCDEEGNLAKLMKRLAGRQTRYVNALAGRSGSLWEGRYKSSPIETETYLMACHRYVELNPVKAGMVKMAGDYRWSSYRQKAGLDDDMWVDEDLAYQGISADRKLRQQRYIEYIDDAMPEQTNRLISDALQRGQLTGSDRFVDEVSMCLGIRIEHRPPGRPRGKGQGKSAHAKK